MLCMRCSRRDLSHRTRRRVRRRRTILPTRRVTLHLISDKVIFTRHKNCSFLVDILIYLCFSSPYGFLLFSFVFCLFFWHFCATVILLVALCTNRGKFLFAKLGLQLFNILLSTIFSLLLLTFFALESPRSTSCLIFIYQV